LEHLQDFLNHAGALNYSNSTLNSYRINLSRFIKWLNTRDIFVPERIHNDHLYEWLQHLAAHRTSQGLPLRPSSVNKNIENTRQFIKYLIKRGCLYQQLLDTLEYVKEPDMLPTSVLTHAQVKKLVSRIKTDTSCGYRDRVMIELLYSSGVRVGELLGLDVPHVNIKDKTAIVTGKGSKQRMVPIGRTALRYIETYLIAIRPFFLRNKKEQALFLNQEGNRMGYLCFLRSIHKYARKAKLDTTVTPHTFRRSCTTELLRSGANMYHVKELLGHKNLNTLRHYAKLTINDLKKTHAKCHPREKDKE